MSIEANIEVIEGNKLIAVFDGLEQDGRYWYRPTGNTEGLMYTNKYNRLEYHSSWDWLMPVYLKIVREELYGDNDEAIIIFNIMYERLADGDGIIEVWKYIVQFIQWHNKEVNQINNQ